MDRRIDSRDDYPEVENECRLDRNCSQSRKDAGKSISGLLNLKGKSSCLEGFSFEIAEPLVADESCQVISQYSCDVVRGVGGVFDATESTILESCVLPKNYMHREVRALLGNGALSGDVLGYLEKMERTIEQEADVAIFCLAVRDIKKGKPLLGVIGLCDAVEQMIVEGDPDYQIEPYFDYLVYMIPKLVGAVKLQYRKCRGSELSEMKASIRGLFRGLRKRKWFNRYDDFVSFEAALNVLLKLR